MFGKNSIVNYNNYKDAYPNTLKITSCFITLQGEGIYSGEIAAFVRLTGCNLQCSFCDTYFDSGDVYNFDDIVVMIREKYNDFYYSRGWFPPSDKNLLIVLTGGEPMLQPNVVEFAKRCHEEGWKTQTESNGLVQKTTLMLPLNTAVIISPKVNEKTGKYLIPTDPVLARADALKFVISKTMNGYQDIPEFALDWMNDGMQRSVYVSPMNMYSKQPEKIGNNGTLDMRSKTDETISFWTPDLLDLKANQENHEYTALIAMKHHAILSLQTHLYASLP